MKRHIIFACIYEYVCTMVMKKFTFLLITLFSSTLILLADNPYRSYTVADGLSNSTVKAIYQDEMGYIWLGTKDGLNRLEFNYDCPSSFLLAIPATLFSVLTSSYRSSLSYGTPSVLQP